MKSRNYIPSNPAAVNKNWKEAEDEHVETKMDPIFETL